MDAAPRNLSGAWSGIYRYPDGNGKPVPFNADLIEEGSVLSGEIREPGRGGVDTVTAMVRGYREGVGVSFFKHYGDLAGYPQRVYYEGGIDATGGRVMGRWRIDGPEGWSGTFLMDRIRGEGSQIMRRAMETAL